MTAILEHHPDTLAPLARLHVVLLLEKLKRAEYELSAIDRERQSRPIGSDVTDLALRHREARTSWDAAAFALELGLGKTPNEAAQLTTQSIIDREHLRQRVERAKDASPTSLLRLVPDSPEAASENGSDDPWMSTRESATHAGKVAPSGEISRAWYAILRLLERQGHAFRHGTSANSQIRVRRSTVDAVLRGELPEGDESR